MTCVVFAIQVIFYFNYLLIKNDRRKYGKNIENHTNIIEEIDNPINNKDPNKNINSKLISKSIKGTNESVPTDTKYNDESNIPTEKQSSIEIEIQNASHAELIESIIKEIYNDDNRKKK